MGGECKAGEAGWEIGVYGNEVTEEGRKWWGDVSGQGRDDKVVSTLSALDIYSPSFLLVLMIFSLFSRWYGIILARSARLQKLTLITAQRRSPGPSTELPPPPPLRKIPNPFDGPLSPFLILFILRSPSADIHNSRSSGIYTLHSLARYRCQGGKWGVQGCRS